MNAEGHCPICGEVLTDENTDRCEWTGNIRYDCLGRAWCISCTEKHDSIDWDEVYPNAAPY